MTQSSTDPVAKPDPENPNGVEGAKPALSPDAQAFIGLKLREFYDDVVAEPVPDRFLELLGRLGTDPDTSKTE